MGKIGQLTDNQLRFCHEYMIDNNATQAAIRAGYAAKSARGTGTRLLKDQRIMAILNNLREEMSRRLKIDADRVLLELARVAFVDPSKIMRKTSRGISIAQTDKLSEDERRCISELSETERGGIRCKLNDKLRALELIGKHLGMFVDRHELSGPGGGPVKTESVNMSDEELERIAAGND